jgi:catechol 2,3-dioxygenase-like lactoylglutathione lyase family enzyme
MPIERILINVADVARSVEFYTTHLDARVVDEVTDSSARLDVVTAIIELARLDDAHPSTWKGDDLQKGFRHVGFKVENVDARVMNLKENGVPFHLDPLDAEGGVRISFFFDPDGTLLEFVQGDLQYHSIADEAGVAAERALGIPDRPRFDHIAITVDDLAATERFYADLGFGNIGTIEQPADPRGFRIDYLRDGDSVLEVFTYHAEKESRRPRLDTAGFVAAGLTSTSPGSAVGTWNGYEIIEDRDGFTLAIGPRA